MTKQGHNLPDCDGTYYANDSHIKERGECAINEEMMAKYNVPKCNPAKRTNIKENNHGRNNKCMDSCGK